MVPFAGYEMPVQYGLGVMKEHLHTRAAAGLFDVSHMGQVLLRHEGGYGPVAEALEALVPVSLLALGEKRQRYGFFTNEDGGILDDLMMANRGDHMFMVVNAACKAADIAHMKAGCPVSKWPRCATARFWRCRALRPRRCWSLSRRAVTS